MKLFNPQALTEEERKIVDEYIRLDKSFGEDCIWTGFGTLEYGHGGWFFKRDTRFTEHDG